MIVPGKKRLSLFTRKQQRLVNKARKMNQTPDLSAILRGQMRSLKKKKSVPEVDDESVEAAHVDSPLAASPVADNDDSAAAAEKGEKKENGPPEEKRESVVPEDGPSEIPEESVQRKSSKKKKGKKRSREASSKEGIEDLNVS